VLCQNHVDVAEGVRRCARCGSPYCPDCLVEIGGRPYCATCKAEQLLDVRSGVDRSHLPLASIASRFGARLIDTLVIAIPFYAVMGIYIILPAFRGQQPQGWANFIGVPYAMLALIYEVLMLQYKDGQTLGKIVFKLRVVRPDGSPISRGQAWGRTGMTTLLFNCCFLLDYVSAFLTPERLTLHDMVAATRVVDVT
jgi:uncharacterized RDD family membrane protein YckC